MVGGSDLGHRPSGRSGASSIGRFLRSKTQLTTRKVRTHLVETTLERPTLYDEEIGVDFLPQEGPAPIERTAAFQLFHWDEEGIRHRKPPRPMEEWELQRKGYRFGKNEPGTYCWGVVPKEDQPIFADWAANKSRYALALAEQALVWAIVGDRDAKDINRVAAMLHELGDRVKEFPARAQEDVEIMRIRAIEKLLAAEAWKRFTRQYSITVRGMRVDELAAPLLMELAVDAVRIYRPNDTPLFLGRVEIQGISLLVTMTESVASVEYRNCYAEFGVYNVYPLTGMETGNRIPLSGMIVRRSSATNQVCEWWVSPAPFQGLPRPLNKSRVNSIFILSEEDEFKAEDL